MYRNLLKPVCDFLLSLSILFLTSPIIIVTTLFLFVINKGKPFFFQQRPGKNERIFNVIKFKTMLDKKDKHGFLLPDADRITWVGNFVRKTSIDELPQLINVLKGDMSLIGPRPLLVKYLSLYNDRQKRRHEVRPGITGWAQVNGRNTISWEQKFEYDVWYVDNLNLWLDIKIIWVTIIKVFKSESINQQGQSTVEYFKGNY